MWYDHGMLFVYTCIIIQTVNKYYLLTTRQICVHFYSNNVLIDILTTFSQWV